MFLYVISSGRNAAWFLWLLWKDPFQMPGRVYVSVLPCLDTNGLNNVNRLRTLSCDILSYNPDAEIPLSYHSKFPLRKDQPKSPACQFLFPLYSQLARGF